MESLQGMCHKEILCTSYQLETFVAESLKEFFHDKEDLVSPEQTVISCTTELRHSVPDLYFDTSEKYDKVFCLQSEASHFSFNKQFAAKFLIRVLSENIPFLSAKHATSAW